MWFASHHAKDTAKGEILFLSFVFIEERKRGRWSCLQSCSTVMVEDTMLEGSGASLSCLFPHWLLLLFFLWWPKAPLNLGDSLWGVVSGRGILMSNTCCFFTRNWEMHNSAEGSWVVVVCKCRERRADLVDFWDVQLMPSENRECLSVILIITWEVEGGGVLSAFELQCTQVNILFSSLTD